MALAVGSRLELEQGMAVADVGAGSGFYTMLMAAQVRPTITPARRSRLSCIGGLAMDG